MQNINAHCTANTTVEVEGMDNFFCKETRPLMDCVARIVAVEMGGVPVTVKKNILSVNGRKFKVEILEFDEEKKYVRTKLVLSK